MKIVIIVSSTAQVSMFKVLIKELENFDIKFITNGSPFKKEIHDLLKKYKFNFETMKRCDQRSVNEFLKKEMPDIILTGHDQIFMEILFIEAANSLGIPSLTIQDGILVADRNPVHIGIKYFLKIPFRFLELLFKEKVPLNYLIDFSKFLMKYKNRYSVYGHGKSSKIALFGESIKNSLIEEGISSDKLEVTGNPKFDNLTEFKGKKESLRKKWNIPQKKKIVVVLTQWFVEAGTWTVEQRELFISIIVEAILPFGDNVQLILKLHPAYEKKEDYLKILENFSISPVIFDLEPIHEIISISDVIISVSSTSALEAMALQKPVLIINLFQEKGPLFFRYSGAIYTEKKEQINSALKKLIYSPDRIWDKCKVEKFLYQQAYLIDGNASKRIADLIVNMVQ